MHALVLAAAIAYARNQVILSIDLANNTPAGVSINGTKIGDFQAFLRLDVARFVHPGKNTLRVIARGSGLYGRVAIVYAARPNEYNEVGHIGDPARLDRPRDRTIDFVLPQR